MIRDRIYSMNQDRKIEILRISLLEVGEIAYQVPHFVHARELENISQIFQSTILIYSKTRRNFKYKLIIILL